MTPEEWEEAERNYERQMVREAAERAEIEQAEYDRWVEEWRALE